MCSPRVIIGGLEGIEDDFYIRCMSWFKSGATNP